MSRTAHPLNNFFNHQTSDFVRASFFIAASSFLSGVLGLLRDRFLAGRFGASGITDIYFAAFRIPDLVTAILVTGGISATFLPLFAQEFKKDREGAFRLASNTLNFFLLLFILICLLLGIFTPELLEIITPGFTSVQLSQTVLLTRIMFLSPILFAASSIFSSILQHFDKFLVYSFAPVLYNLGIITGILFLEPAWGIAGLAWGVILGAAAHFLIQVPAAYHSGYQYFRIFDFRDRRLEKMLRLMVLPGLGLAFLEINLLVVTALASRMSQGSLSVFTFAKNLQSLPITLIGLSFAISAFPLLSRSWSQGQRNKFWQELSLALRQILFLIIPLSFLTFLLRAQIVRLILGTGKFGWEATRLTAASLGIFSWAVFVYALIPLLRRTFFSFSDTKTPTLAIIFAVFVNIFLSITLVYFLGFSNFFRDALARLLKLEDLPNLQVLAFPLALAISGTLHSLALFWLFASKTKLARTDELVHSLKKILLAALIMSVGVYWSLKPLAVIFPLRTFGGVFLQTSFASLGGIALYLLISFFLKSPELETLKISLLKPKT